MRAGPAALLAALTLAACAEPPRPALPDGLAIRADTVEIRDDRVRYTARIAYPQAVAPGGAALPPSVAAANRVLADSVRAFALAVRPSDAPPAEDTTYAVAVAGGYDAAFLGGGWLSALVTIVVDTGGSDGNVFLQPMTVDLTTGGAVRLGDLFAPNAPYGGVLAERVERAVVDRLARRLGVPRAEARARAFAPSGLASLQAGDAAFTLGADSLYLHVLPNELASGATEVVTVGVPYGALARFARRGGAVRELAAQ